MIRTRVADHLLTSDSFAPEDSPFGVGKKVDLAVHIGAVERQQIVCIGLTRHPIDAEVPDHLNRAVIHFVRVEIGRPEFDVEIGDLSPDPPLDDVVPRLVGPYDVPFHRVFAFSCTAENRRTEKKDQNTCLPHRRLCSICTEDTE
jgi:hypothetical protein